MIPKKTPRADLANKRVLIFNISLVISLLLVVMAFEWRQPVAVEKELRNSSANNQEQVQDVPVTEIPPPPPPKKLESPQIVEVPNEEKIEEEIDVSFDTEMTESTELTEYTINPDAKVVEVIPEETNEIFLVVEEKAVPKDGLAAFYRSIGEKIVYPPQALRMGIEGKVFVQFVVNKDGSFSDLTVVKGIGFGCDEEAVRVLSEAPPWQPARQRGRPVRQRMVLPILFKIHNNYL